MHDRTVNKRRFFIYLIQNRHLTVTYFKGGVNRHSLEIEMGFSFLIQNNRNSSTFLNVFTTCLTAWERKKKKTQNKKSLN